MFVEAGNVCLNLMLVLWTASLSQPLFWQEAFIYLCVSFHKRHLHVIAKLHLGNCDRSNHTVDDCTGNKQLVASNSAQLWVTTLSVGNVEIPHGERRDQNGVRGFHWLEAKGSKQGELSVWSAQTEQWTSYSSGVELRKE